MNRNARTRAWWWSGASRAAVAPGPQPPKPGEHIDPSQIPLRRIAAIRGAMWTVRGPWRYGPRPGSPDNITALEFLHSYGDPYNPDALGGAYNLNSEQQAMLDTYLGFQYTHSCTGPVTAQSYHGQYPDYLFNTKDTFERYLDWLQCFWDHGICPIIFLHPDNWDLAQTQDLYEPLIRGNARAQKLMRAVVPAGWEPTQYGWSSVTWASYQKWAHDLLPNALILLHTVTDVDAPAGGDDAFNDDDHAQNPTGNAGAWSRVAPYIHGWLHQSAAFAEPNAIGDPNHPTKTNYDNWADLFDPTCSYSFYNRFHHGYAGWPTHSLWGDEAIYLIAGEFCSYWNYNQNRPYEEGVGWGDRALRVGADGYLDSGHAPVPIPMTKAEREARVA